MTLTPWLNTCYWIISFRPAADIYSVQLSEWYCAQSWCRQPDGRSQRAVWNQLQSPLFSVCAIRIRTILWYVRHGIASDSGYVAVSMDLPSVSATIQTLVLRLWVVALQCGAREAESVRGGSAVGFLEVPRWVGHYTVCHINYRWDQPIRCQAEALT